MTTDLASRSALRGIAVTCAANAAQVTATPRLVRQHGVVETVTPRAITVRCGDGFAESYVLLADLAGPDADDSFERLSPGDEVLVTSWLDDPDPPAGQAA
jgi:hypothetical protein